jgi:hypothetical protein
MLKGHWRANVILLTFGIRLRREVIRAALFLIIGDKSRLHSSAFPEGI